MRLLREFTTFSATIRTLLLIVGVLGWIVALNLISHKNNSIISILQAQVNLSSVTTIIMSYMLNSFYLNVRVKETQFIHNIREVRADIQTIRNNTDKVEERNAAIESKCLKLTVNIKSLNVFILAFNFTQSLCQVKYSILQISYSTLYSCVSLLHLVDPVS